MNFDRAKLSVCAAVVTLFATGTQVLAAGEGDAHSGGPSLFTGDLGNIFWTLITFVFVLVVLGKFAWGPILSALKQREDFIRDSLATAKKDREAAEARLKEYEEKLATARAEATGIVEEGRRDAEVVKQKIQEDAKAAATAMIDRAKREIGIATDTAVKQLYTLGAGLATDVASRMIGREVNAMDHERLINDSIAELEAAGNGRSDG